MLEIFEYGFMIRAFAAGVVTAIIAPLVGTFLVTRRYSLVADSFAHMALAGIAIGLIAHLNPVATALVVTLLAAVYIEKLRADQRTSGDTALAIFLSGGLAIAVVLMSAAKGFNADLLSYLFGLERSMF
jgi:zinc transport system permease protein